MNSSGLLARPKWMNQEKYNDINKNIKDGEDIIIKELLDGWVGSNKGASEGGNVARGAKSNLQFILTEDYLSSYIKNNTEDIKEITPEKIEEEMYNKDVKNMLDELNKNIRTINKSLLLIADVLKERGINNENK